MKTAEEKQLAIDRFKQVTLEVGDLRVRWEHIGEGWGGDYNDQDPEDEPLLRFSCSRYNPTPEGGDVEEGGQWEEMPDASYCTRMPVDSLRWQLVKSAEEIMDAIENADYKRRLEQLSWLCPEDFDKILKAK